MGLILFGLPTYSSAVAYREWTIIIARLSDICVFVFHVTKHKSHIKNRRAQHERARCIIWVMCGGGSAANLVNMPNCKWYAHKLHWNDACERYLHVSQHIYSYCECLECSKAKVFKNQLCTNNPLMYVAPAEECAESREWWRFMTAHI